MPLRPRPLLTLSLAAASSSLLAADVFGQSSGTGGASSGGASSRGASSGGASSGGTSAGPGGAAAAGRGQALSIDAYSLRGIYFKRESYESPADCLTAAYAKGLPLEVCQ